MSLPVMPDCGIVNDLRRLVMRGVTGLTFRGRIYLNAFLHAFIYLCGCLLVIIFGLTPLKFTTT